MKIMAQAMNDLKSTDSMQIIEHFEKGAQFDILKSRPGYFRGWDHQLMQQMYTLTPKKKGAARDKWDFLQLGATVPNADESLEIIAPTREENPCNLT
jgi:branched-chain amino acid transport system substrate-binding protein